MINDTIDGLTSYLSALTTIQHQRLWRYFLVPAMISLILFVVIFGSAWFASGHVGEWLMRVYPWEFGANVIEKSAAIIGGILLATLGLIIYKNAVMALSAPFMSLLSERLEKQMFSDAYEQPMTFARWLTETVRGIRIAIRSLVREVGFTLLILMLGLIPFFAPFSALLIFLLQSYYAGFGSMDFTLERHFNVKDSIRFTRDFRGLAIGNGAIFILLLMTGIGFLVALPWSTVAATQEVLKRLE